MPIMMNTLPKVLLHDHLDGGLRIETILDLAEQQGYDALPSQHPETLARWFEQTDATSLEEYLEAFAHTVGVMQTAGALERVAYEAVVDVAADGVVYAEFRFAPHLHLTGGLTPGQVVEAVLAGLRRGTAETGTRTGLILDGMRHQNDSLRAAHLAVEYAGRGVVGFDLAGPERGFPPDDHLPACRTVREADLGLTLHAGEGDGLRSIWAALQRCSAHRLGHGVRIVDDCVVEHGDITKTGRLASYVRDFGVPMEVCPRSNLQTLGIAPEAHPLGMLYRAGFTVTLNTDNRLMSRVSLSDEFAFAARHHGFELPDLLSVTENAVWASFAPLSVKKALLTERIRPAYA